MAVGRLKYLSDWAQILIIQRFHHACQFAAWKIWHFQLLTHHYIPRATHLMIFGSLIMSEFNISKFITLVLGELLVDQISKYLIKFIITLWCLWIFFFLLRFHTSTMTSSIMTQKNQLWKLQPFSCIIRLLSKVITSFLPQYVLN